MHTQEFHQTQTQSGLNFQGNFIVCKTKIGTTNCTVHSVYMLNNNITHRSAHLHEISQAPLTEDIFEEHHVLFVIGIRPQLRGQQGQRFMEPYRGGE